MAVQKPAGGLEAGYQSGLAPTRFDVLDFYRYGGALFVAITHYVVIFLPLEMPMKERFHEGFQPLIGFFFTLSGFVITHVHDRDDLLATAGYLRFMRKRFARIYPLHFLTFVVAASSGLLSDFAPDAILPNLFLVHAWYTTSHLSFNFPSWSVSAELFAYLLFPLLLFASKRFNPWSASLLPAAAALAVTVLFGYLNLPSWMHANYDLGCLRALPSFIAGIAVYRLVSERFASLSVPGWVAHAAAIATIPLMVLNCPSIVVILGVFPAVVFLLAKAEPRSPGVFSSRTARAFSNCSYSFYMWHAFVGVLLLDRLPAMLHLPDFYKYGLALCALACTTIISMLSFQAFEDPARRYLAGNQHAAQNEAAKVALRTRADPPRA